MLDLLQGTRVLDLADDRGEVAGWLLAHLGAEVVKAEPPGGCPSRRDAARYATYNAGKSSIVLGSGDAIDTALLRALVEWADVVIDTGPPGRLAELGPAAEVLRGSQVYVLVTAFGADGPRAEQPSSELTIAALGGPVRIQGAPERPPVQISVPQVWRHTGAEAAVAALVGRRVAAANGSDREPVVIDVSAQHAMTWTMLNSMEAAQVQGFDFERSGATLELAMRIPLRRPAADGHVILVPTSRSVIPLLDQLALDGVIDDRWRSEDWASWDQRVIEGEPVTVDPDEVVAALDRWCRLRTKAELLRMGQELGVTIAPINTVADLTEFEQLDARGFWVENDAGRRRPGGFITVDGTRSALTTSAAEPDADRGAVLAALSGRESRHRSTRPPARRGDVLPFDGVKVADFSWIGVGPITAKCLADHGATVVRIESANRIDGLRVQPPFKDGRYGVDRSNFYGAFNTSKWSLACGLKDTEGLAAARDMIAWADIVIDSFTPGAMTRLGLGPEQVRAVNPRAITVTTSLLGAGGPYSSMAGYGYHAAAIAGFFELVGYPDGEPEGPWLAYTDTIGPRFITPTLLAALDRRDRTGKGAHIEAAQLEIALQFLGPELAEFVDGGVVAGRLGNRDRHLAPQGLYPCAGQDCWVALTVVDDGTWVRLAALLGLDDDGLATVDARRDRHAEIDEAIAAWTASRTEVEAEAELLAAGVPAGAVQRSSDLAVDPQIRHRRFYRHLDHVECGPTPYAGHQYRIRPYPAVDAAQGNGPRFAAPGLGQHTFEVLTDLLGWDAERVALAMASGALE